MSVLHASVKCTRPLSRDEQRELHARHVEGDADATDALVQSCIPLVLSVAGRRAGRDGDTSVDLADVVSVGISALVECLGQWDPERGTLAGWAWRPIRWKIGQYIHREMRARDVASQVECLNPRYVQSSDPDVVVDEVDRRITVSDIILVAGRVDRRGPEIVRSRMAGQTFREIGGRLGVTRERVRQISDRIRDAAREQISCRL